MGWGSTRPGELFTGSKRCETAIQDDRISLWVDSEPSVVLSLIQLRALQVSPGVMWATCHFDFQKGEETVRSMVDRIPNEQTPQKLRAVADATTDALSTFLAAANTGKLESWMDQVVGKLKPDPGSFVVRPPDGATSGPGNDWGAAKQWNF